MCGGSGGAEVPAELFKPDLISVLYGNNRGKSAARLPRVHQHVPSHLVSHDSPARARTHALGFDKVIQKRPSAFEYVARMSSFIINRRQNVRGHPEIARICYIYTFHFFLMQAFSSNHFHAFQTFKYHNVAHAHTHAHTHLTNGTKLSWSCDSLAAGLSLKC